MSNYTKHKTTIMPKITQSVRMDQRNINIKKSYTRNEDNPNIKMQSSNIPEILDKEKKPGSSIDRKKPLYIFPKIVSKIPPSTANAITSSEPISYKINNLHGIKIKKSMSDETDKNELMQNNNNKINMNYDIHNNNNINDININNNHEQPTVNDYVEEKKLVNNKINVDINNYKDISINFLINNNELNQMFEQLYKNDYNAKKKWIDLHLFGREVFKIRLETYIKNKMDIPSFIKNEINKILSNQYCDYLFAKSYKQIEEQYDEHMKDIENIYN
jgi:hypothetical protein